MLVTLVLFLLFKHICSLIDPYVFVDFNKIKENGGTWEISDRDQTVTEAHTFFWDAAINLVDSSANDDNTNNVGAAKCESNNLNTFGEVYLASIPNFNEYTLEAIVKIRDLDATVNGFIIGLEGLFMNMDTNANGIGFNTDQKRFFPANYETDGWTAPTTYYNNFGTLIEENKFYHVIVTVDINGFVNVYVNGNKYGTTYQITATGPFETLGGLAISICGDYSTNVGGDFDIYGFGFYNTALDSSEVKEACEYVETLDGLSGLCAPVCVYGQNYFVEGTIAWVSGDPHFQTFNGERHDFMGVGSPNNQYYYMTRCNGKTKQEMPFNILGKHAVISGSSIRSLDYITIELFDNNNNYYLIFLSSNIQKYTSNAVTYTTTSTLYDLFDNTLLSQIQVGIETQIGNRFKIILESQTTSRITFKLIIDGICEINLIMQSQGRFNTNLQRNTMQYLQILPPQCYKCLTCGLLGDFLRAPVPGINGRLRTCSGGYMPIVSGWTSALSLPTAYDINGLTWSKSFCDRTINDNRRRLTEIDYEPSLPDGFILDNPCIEGSDIELKAIEECQNQRNFFSTVCIDNLVSVCDELQNDCNYDACASSNDISEVASNAENIFGNALGVLEDTDNINDLFNADNLVESSRNFVVVNEFLGFEEANERCIELYGTTLASILNEEENNAIKNACFISSSGNCWIGFKQDNENESFYWIDGNDVSYTNWAIGEPNNSGDEDCTEMYSNGEFNDLRCYIKRRFVCNGVTN